MRDVLEPWRIGTHTVPGLWRYLLPSAAHQWRLPVERHASCQRCPKVVTHHFRPDYRCCTFHPRIPNYMLGFALEAGGAFAERIRTRAQMGYLTPEGSHHTPAQWFQALAADKAGEYGRGERVLCHYLEKETGLCTAYAFRNSACATYHCENDHGAVGAAFWDALHHYLSRVEFALADWSLEQAGFDLPRYRQVFDELTAQPLTQVNEPSTQAWRAEAYRRLWLDYAGRETELYLACASVVYRERDQLVAIAQERLLALPLTTEVAQLESMSVQARGQDEGISEEAEENEELIPISKLWTVCEKKVKRLWRPLEPGTKLCKHDLASVEPNPNKEDIEQFFAHCPGVLRIWAWRHERKRLAREQFLTPAEYAALLRLSGGVTWDEPMRMELQGLGIAVPEDFVIEMLRVGALTTGRQD